MISRRRIIRILAKVSFCSGLSPVISKSAALTKKNNDFEYKEYEWRGVVLGAESVITLHHYNADEAHDLLNSAVNIIQKYEKIFSLYLGGSDINQLNEKGYIESNNVGFLDLIKKSIVISHQTKGAFDITVQPLWKVLKDDFDLKGVVNEASERLISDAVTLINYKNILIRKNKVSFKKVGMGITLNGIAQGYITDKVAEFFKVNNIDNILCDLGEIRAIGPQGDGSPWNIAIFDPARDVSEGGCEVIELKNGAIATSSILEEGIGRFHLINSAAHNFKALKPLHKSITVLAPSATIADGFSTAFMNMPKSDIAKVTRSRGDIKVYCTDVSGSKIIIA